MTYTPRYPSWEHQLEYKRRLDRRPRKPSEEDVFAILGEMGTGKSKMVLDEWGPRAMRGDVPNHLIIAPAGSYGNWFRDKTADQLSELKTHLDPELFAQLRFAPWISGGRVSDRKEIERVLRHKGPRCLIINVEALSTVQKAVDACHALFETGRTMVTVDESTRIKNSGARRTKTVVTLGRNDAVAARRIMTGLVTPRDPMDLYSQFEFLDWRILGHKSFFSFRARYAVMQRMNFNGKKQNIIVGFRNQDELQAKIEPYRHRVLLEDCLDMPGETFLWRDVELYPEQRKAIRELLENSTTQLSGGAHVTTTIKLATLTRIDQILLGWVVDEEGGTHEVPTRRYAALMDVLGDHSGKAIIWTSMQESAQRAHAEIEKEYGRGSAALFYGPNKSTRHLEEARFLGDPACRFMVSTPAAGGVGNTWNVATLRVYLNNGNDLEHRLQSEKRNYRGGQKKPVTSVDLTAPEVPVEMRKITALRKKLDVASIISGDEPRTWLV